MLKRRIDRILSEGEGRQLAWLAGLATVLFLVLCLIGGIWAIGWTDILNLYLDPGGFPLEGHNIFSLVVAFGGILLLNALAVSAFSNVFDNISEKYRKGERRYRIKGHILFLGGGGQLLPMLRALRSGGGPAEIVVMTSGDVEALRDAVQTALDDAAFCRRITWYRGERDNADDLRSACASLASLIYIIGEDGEPAHDSVSVAALELLRGICTGEGPAIPCFVTIERQTSLDIFNYLGKEPSPRLRTELVHTGDYLAEQLLAGSDFLPVPPDDGALHLVIAGSGRIARSVAGVTAQICHFPGYAKTGRRTVITFVDEGIRGRMSDFVAEHGNLFTLSHYSYISPEGSETHAPDPLYGDFLDIEWEFVDAPISSPIVRGKLESLASGTLAVVVCSGDADADLDAALHLPKAVYDASVPVAVYLKDHPELLEKAAASGQFGALRCFGEAAPGSDALLLRRSQLGQRVNRVYDRLYGNPPAASEDEAWAALSFAHKLSSIQSANSIPLKLRTFGIEPTREGVDSLDDDTLLALSEVEHRRWMASALLMGYSAAPEAARRDRSDFRRLKNERFIHLDIAPFSELDGVEAGKDTAIILELPYIISGE